MDLQMGSYVEVVINNDAIVKTFAADSKHRVDPRQKLRGTVVAAPSWLRGPHLCLLNSETKVINYVPEHRIVAVNDSPPAERPKSRDRAFSVTSSKTGEVYTVRLNGNTRQWTCACTGWQFHKKCRHTVRCEHQAERIILTEF